MSEQHGPYHRRGGPGGPGARVLAMQIQGRLPDGRTQDAELLDAGKDATEVELLRTVCQGLGIHWGEGEFGWWAVVPTSLTPD